MFRCAVCAVSATRHLHDAFVRSLREERQLAITFEVWNTEAKAAPVEEAAWDPFDIVKAQTGRFHYLWYETPRTLDGWVAASQEHQRWGVRLMTEAFRRDRRHVS